jgi:hypothetical protein
MGPEGSLLPRVAECLSAALAAAGSLVGAVMCRPLVRTACCRAQVRMLRQIAQQRAHNAACWLVLQAAFGWVRMCHAYAH